MNFWRNEKPSSAASDRCSTEIAARFSALTSLLVSFMSSAQVSSEQDRLYLALSSAGQSGPGTDALPIRCSSG